MKICVIKFCFFLLFLLLSAQSFAQEKGQSCTIAQENSSACHLTGCFVCKSQIWEPQPLFHGETTATCTTAIAGTIRTQASTLEYCNGTSWIALQTSGQSSNPTPFGFSNQYNVPFNTTTTSDAIVLSGFASALSATCGTGCTNIAKNGSWLGTTATGFYAGDTIQIQQTSATAINTASSATVTVGSTISQSWRLTTTNDPCNGNTPVIGAVCTDGSLYAGLSPDGNVRMFTTRCDRSMTWDGSACTSVRATHQWGTQGVLRNLLSSITGKSNSATLAAVDAQSDAGKGCENLVQNAKTDWYLPAKDELTILYNNRATLGNFDLTGTYWSSTEGDANGARALRFSDGYQMNEGKVATFLARCVRR